MAIPSDLIAYLTPPIELPHRDGGSLRLLTSQLRARLDVEVIRLDAEACDILRLAKTVVDEEGRAHTFTTYLSAYELWACIAGAIVCTEPVHLQGGGQRVGSQQAVIAERLNIWSDGREPRVFGLQADRQQQPYLFSCHEKYFSATADLLLLRSPPLPSGHQPGDSVYARITVRVRWPDATGKYHLGPTPLMVQIPPELLLFRNHQRLSVVDEEIGPTWNRAMLPQPIEVRLAEAKGGPPHAGVKWLR